MRNAEKWQASKYVMKGGRLRATTDKRKLSPGSRLMGDLVAEAYGTALKVHARGRLLDVGCGEVPLYEAYREYVSGIQCIDWASSEHGNDYVDKACDLTGPIPYPDRSFDTIILSDVLEHLPEPTICWHEMNRVLAPNGKVLLNVPFYYQVHETPHDYYRYTEFALMRFAERAGFEVIELKPLGGALEIIADVTSKLLAGIRLNAAALCLQWAARSFSRSRWGSRVARRTSDRFPIGYFMVAAKAETASEAD